MLISSGLDFGRPYEAKLLVRVCLSDSVWIVQVNFVVQSFEGRARQSRLNGGNMRYASCCEYVPTDAALLWTPLKVISLHTRLMIQNMLTRWY